ncbi:MAG: hypothetical protein IPK22_21440 [Verrucomicrobiaceae bacterium]|nr:hypothetical protein [Verrucomicrobiaceae bacterium]
MIAQAHESFASKLAAIQRRATARRTSSTKTVAAWDVLNPRLVSEDDDAIFCEAMRLGEQWREAANREGK